MWFGVVTGDRSNTGLEHFTPYGPMHNKNMLGFRNKKLGKLIICVLVFVDGLHLSLVEALQPFTWSTDLTLSVARNLGYCDPLSV